MLGHEDPQAAQDAVRGDHGEVAQLLQRKDLRCRV